MKSRTASRLTFLAAALASAQLASAATPIFSVESKGNRGEARVIDIYIAKTRYSNKTGFRAARGSYDGLEFVNVVAPTGTIRLHGHDADHKIENVLFHNCSIGGNPVDNSDDINTNEFVSDVKFKITNP